MVSGEGVIRWAKFHRHYYNGSAIILFVLDILGAEYVIPLALSLFGLVMLINNGPQRSALPLVVLSTSMAGSQERLKSLARAGLRKST